MWLYLSPRDSVRQRSKYEQAFRQKAKQGEKSGQRDCVGKELAEMLAA